jgi:TetR/AcrR family transcriptional repressor of mexJK operon
MEDIAALAGLAKRTVYNNYPDKESLFDEIVQEVIAYAEGFARGVREEFGVGISAANLRVSIDDLGRRLALAILRPEVIALRRLLIGETRTLPSLAREYFDRVPGQVIGALASGFERLGHAGLRVSDGRRAAAQFAYLVVGELLDRAMLTGTIPPEEYVIACARDGVETFLARYATARRGRR